MLTRWFAASFYSRSTVKVTFLSRKFHKTNNIPRWEPMHNRSAVRTCGMVVISILLNWILGRAQSSGMQEYEPTLNSLNLHPLLLWQADANFAIFLHEVLYSVQVWSPLPLPI